MRLLKFLSPSLFVLSNFALAEMDYVDLCRSPGDCKKLSRLVLGTDHLVQANWQGRGEAEKTEEEVFAFLDKAVEQGFNFFDTSPIYVGGVENKLGRWMRSRQDSVFALSKGGFPFDLSYLRQLPPGAHSEELKRTLQGRSIPAGTYASRLFGDKNLIEQRVAEELAHSLENLNSNILIYLMHRDDGDYVGFNEVPRQKTPLKNILEALGSEQIASKFWALGVSNWKSSRIEEALDLSFKNKAYSKPLLNSPYFSLFEMKSSRSIHAGGVQVTHEDMMNLSYQKGIKIMPYSPLGGFSIFDKPEPRWENAKQAARELKDRGDAYWQNVFESIFTEENEARYRRVLSFTQSFNQKHKSRYSVDQMINAYALAHPRTDFLAVGPITEEQMKRTVEALRLSKMLKASDLDYLYRGHAK